MKVYGIKNCNTVKKALEWLTDHNKEIEFHDYKKLGVTEAKLEEWSETLGWEALLNKRGTTWKQLDPAAQAQASTKEGAFKLMQEKTSVIKRPLVETGKGLLLGFDEGVYNEHFG